ncbi:MAG: ATP-binding cassette domain-containing protein [Bacteroidales bacterium]|jgi:ABC-type Fe3+/spermidine/putrescine transport system ATPase subunit|nr:ATP-binding cassette domain-containing protein [Bacteroidales bacterium]
MVKLENITYKAGQFTLGPINLELPKGSYTALLGPSGSGKSVMLELIAGLRFPEKGKIFIDEIDMTNTPARKRPVGMLFQDYALFPHMTVEENIGFPLSISGADKAAVARETGRIATLFKIEGLLKRAIKDLSGGEKQRCALARAMAHQPSVLLLDEPLSALDEELREEAVKTLTILKKEGQTVLHVTHNKGETDGLATSSLLIRGGKII